MSFKIVLVFCVQVLIQDISAQCIGAPLAAVPRAGAWGAPYAMERNAPAFSLSASNGPGVAVATASPFLPAGVSILSENAYEGTLAVEGALPFLGTVAFEGALPTAGAGVVAYRCGSGVVGITAEDNVVGVAGIAGPVDYSTIGAPLVGGPLAAAPMGVPMGTASLAASNGPGLAIASFSPLIPNGVSVQSQNAYEGALAVGGAVPFLGTVAFEGALPTAGAGVVAYGCGNGAVGITAEDIEAVDFGIARSGWGCGAI